MQRHTFQTLDGLRGIAALAVVLYHLSGPLHALAPRGYLAVDLFFLMSGFVVAAAYEERLRAGMSVAAFMSVRLKRLWPLYALGTLAGLAAFLAIRLLRPDLAFVFPHMPLGAALLMSLLLLPQIGAYGGPAFPFNGASWSLSVEVFGNLAYAFLRRALTNRMLCFLAAAGAMALVVAGWRGGDLNAGVMPQSTAAGYARFLYSFSLGVLFFRLHRTGSLPRWKPPLALPLAMAALCFTGLGGSGALIDLAIVTVAFPVVVLCALENPRDARTARVFNWAGASSYPLYLLHPPLVELASALLPRTLEPWRSAAVLVAALVLALLALRVFDRPLQAMLRRTRTRAPAPG